MTDTITVRYFAAARASAAVSHENVELPRTHVNRDELIELLASLHPVAPAGELPLSRVLPQCSFLVNGAALTTGTVHPGDRVDVLPPFAGG